MTLRFRCDEAKASSNPRLFADPFAFSEQESIEGGERRWQTIGLVEGFLVLLVAHTVEDEDEGIDVITVISARRADRSERLRYEKERHRHLRIGP